MVGMLHHRILDIVAQHTAESSQYFLMKIQPYGYAGSATLGVAMNFIQYIDAQQASFSMH